MANYTKITNFASKDSLATGNPAKVIKGTEHDNEYNAIATAISTKGDQSEVDLKAPINNAHLTGTTIIDSGTVTALNSTTANITNLVVNTITATNGIFPTGTRMLFAQASAPSGWTQDTSDTANNRMMRVVNTAGGGVAGTHSPILNNVVPAHTHGFSTGTVSANHTHAFTTGTESANHSHSVYDPGHTHGITSGNASNAGGYNKTTENVSSTIYTAYAGTGISLYTENTAHVHSGTTGTFSANHYHSGSTDNGSSQTNWAPRYINIIICTKA